MTDMSVLQGMLTLTGDQPAAIHGPQSLQQLLGCLHAVLRGGVQPQQVSAIWAAPLGQLQGGNDGQLVADTSWIAALRKLWAHCVGPGVADSQGWQCYMLNPCTY